jgi:alkanesulfonate monooxygenase SsuD/methylene tetrahydromethanopterin reductase-like flavin-dependent oxidoreductase (luciferase family)
MLLKFGFCAPIFAGARDVHPRTPLLERVDLSHLQQAIVEAEKLEFDALWVADHLMLGRDSLVLEGWTFLSWASRLTSRMRLGTIHMANLFREPALAAKMGATLDNISKGRFDFFFEAGHRGSKREAEAFGFKFADDASRMAAFEEAVQIVKAMWTEDRPSFSGQHYSIKEAICYPKPVQKPHPPIWIGTLGGEGASESISSNDTTLEIVARHADGWNNTPASVEHCRTMLTKLKAACDRNGREFSQIHKSLETQILIAETTGQVERLKQAIAAGNPAGDYSNNWDQLSRQYLIGDPDTVIRRLSDYADTGITNFQLWFMDYPSLDGLRTFSRRVMPYFAGN